MPLLQAIKNTYTIVSKLGISREKSLKKKEIGVKG